MRGSQDDMPRVGAYVVRLLVEMTGTALWGDALVLIDAPAGLAVAMQLQLQLQAERFGSMIQHPETSSQVLLLPHSRHQYSRSMRVVAELDGRPCLTQKVRASVAIAGDIAFSLQLTPAVVFPTSDGAFRPNLRLEAFSAAAITVPPRRYSMMYDLPCKLVDCMQRIGDFAVLQWLHVDPYATRNWQLAEDDFCGTDTDERTAAWEKNAAALYDGLTRMHKAHAAATCIQAAFRSWRCREEVLWNPTTQAGRRRVLLDWMRSVKGRDADADSPARLKPAMPSGRGSSWTEADWKACEWGLIPHVREPTLDD
jgi:hypothetical protein